MSLIMGIIGIVLDKPKWLAITIVAITSVLFMLWFGIPFLSMLCS
jgi:hypothetical protein